MPRGTPTYTTGTIPLQSTATDVVDDLLVVIESALSGYLSNSTAAWEIYEEVDGALGSRDRVYRSVGDRTLASGAGDTSLFARLTRTGDQLTTSAYHDWSQLDSAGSREVTNGTANYTNDAVDYFVSLNEYEVHIVTIQGSTSRYIGWGNPERVHVDSGHAGVGFTTAAVVASSSPVSVAMDRDLRTSLQTGRRVWVAERTPSAGSLAADNVEIATVSNVTATTVEFTSLSTGFGSGAIVGWDPMCLLAWVRTSGSIDGANAPSDGVGNDGTSGSLTGNLPFTDVNEAGEDPHLGTEYYMGQHLYIEDPVTGPRGRFTVSAYWGAGAQTDPAADNMIDVGSSARYTPFPDLTHDSRLLSIRQ